MIWFSGSTAAAEIDRQIMTSDCVALLTAPGVAAIAVVRLTGPGVNRFLRKHFSKPVPAGVCVYGNLVDGDRMIDDAVAVCHENQLDLNLHGGTWVVQSVLQLAQTLGFKISDRNAVEGVCDQWQQVLLALPRAHTEQAVRMLLSQPAAWESAVDLEKVMADRSGYWMLNLPRVAIVGPANVGKSTIANQLFGQARSITADLPGTTRDWVGEIANIDGLAVMLLDMPGQRNTDDPIEQAAITASGRQIDSADLIVLVLDQSVELDAHLLRQYPKAICVANKTDVKHRWHAAQINAVETIAILGQGLDALRAEIRRRFDCEPMDLGRARWWTTQQRDYLNKNGNLTNTS